MSVFRSSLGGSQHLVESGSLLTKSVETSPGSVDVLFHIFPFQILNIDNQVKPNGDRDSNKIKVIVGESGEVEEENEEL